MAQSLIKERGGLEATCFRRQYCQLVNTGDLPIIVMVGDADADRPDHYVELGSNGSATCRIKSGSLRIFWVHAEPVSNLPEELLAVIGLLGHELQGSFLVAVDQFCTGHCEVFSI